VGYALGAPDLITAFNKVRNHFGVGRAAQAGAMAALADQGYLASVLSQISQSRNDIADLAEAHGLAPIPSATNFVALDCGRDGAFAKAVLDGLVARGIFVRMPFADPQNRCIRVSCGSAQDLAHLAAALPDALADARKG
ncbi:MAG: aminotransferase class I/II-fold pyridoxal phosphate-dependent enzyme, partial [Rhodobacteraceae bacterium]|nr:aminotransferase class I/II-fold pyridoxal phosphate-dependent enzyme [Paracoccaceae bacterium]